MAANRFSRLPLSIALRPSRSIAGPSTERIAYHSRQFQTSSPSKGAWDGPLSQAKLNRYLVVAEDFPNPGALARRLEVRDAHMADVRKGAEVGRVELGGGLLSKDFRDVSESDSPVYSLCGSAFVVQAESLDEVRQRVLQDEYVLARAWDPSSLKIYPFLPAFFQPQAEQSSVKEQMDVIDRRTPRGISQSRAKLIRRNEVFIKDPRTSGAALNKADRATIQGSLSELRRVGGERAGPRKATLDNLRKYSVPPMYSESA
ncbi:uncharacterized protein FA14DRAFT_162667 [Meira miltonrushii]|uniref:YCII-related domain-containing protein n=1 Tax=Meira miltonrushii TaxID=1280837 RepID=A0A316V2K8_9BASI|nr:uncharacterized protein FA14DRAFT_162667 [Meira miltonrushii]PWN31786.1 hypothetical protein FA14DRAFT_162667 [Meira miltonrushii]